MFRTRQWAKHALTSVFPSYYAEMSARRYRAHAERLEREWGCSDLTARFIQEHGPVVRRGPCEGVSFVPAAYHRHLTPKLLGAYEEELHDVWDDVFDRQYAQVLDIGAADGCYAVGLALRYPHADVFAFDTDAWARGISYSMAESNSAQNLIVLGACTHAWLQTNLREGSFLLSDCEGFEDQLLDPTAVPVLRSCDVLVELHETAVPGVIDRMKDRFSASHKLTFITPRESNPSDYPEIKHWSSEEQSLAVSDLRWDDEQVWMYARIE